ncbi:MAG: ABC transporter permease [Candidatus Hydrothermales bacterium]
MKVHIFLILRFLRLKSGFLLSVLALLSVLGIFLGVTALILVTGVISGFHSEIKSRILSLTPHILIQRFGDEGIEDTKAIVDKLRMINGIENVIEYRITKTLFKNKDFVDGGVIRGLPEENFPLKERLKKSILEGKYMESDNSILLGEYLAYRLRAEVGDSILIVIPLEDKFSPMFFPVKTEKFIVAGIFDLGYYEYNASFAFIPMRKFKRLLKGPNRLLEVVLKEPYNADIIKKKIDGILKYPFYSLTWTEMNKSLFSALKLEKLALFLILSILIFVASFMIMGNLFVLMAKKTREIGILMCLGFQKNDVFKIFLMEGLLLGTVGIFSGILIGSFLGFIAGKFKLIKLPPDVYFIDYLPISLNLKDIFLILLSSFLIVIFSSTIPAIRASRILPRDALRYE